MYVSYFYLKDLDVCFYTKGFICQVIYVNSASPNNDSGFCHRTFYFTFFIVFRVSVFIFLLLYYFSLYSWKLLSRTFYYSEDLPLFSSLYPFRH